MKKIFTVAVLVVVMGVTLFAQNISNKPVVVKKLMGFNGDHDNDGIANHIDQDFITKFKPKWDKEQVEQNKVVKTLNKTCPNPNGQALGDGTKPQPRDGTGFGYKACNRQRGNNCKRIKGKKGHGRSLRDGSCKKACFKGRSRKRCNNGETCQMPSKIGCGKRSAHKHCNKQNLRQGRKCCHRQRKCKNLVNKKSNTVKEIFNKIINKK